MKNVKIDSLHEPDPARIYKCDCSYLRMLTFHEVCPGDFGRWTKVDPTDLDTMCLRLIHRGTGWTMEVNAPYARVLLSTKTPASLPACVKRLAGMSRRYPLRDAQRSTLEAFAGLFRR